MFYVVLKSEEKQEMFSYIILIDSSFYQGHSKIQFLSLMRKRAHDDKSDCTHESQKCGVEEKKNVVWGEETWNLSQPPLKRIEIRLTQPDYRMHLGLTKNTSQEIQASKRKQSFRLPPTPGYTSWRRADKDGQTGPMGPSRDRTSP